MAVKDTVVQVMSLNMIMWLLMLCFFSGLLVCAGSLYFLLLEPIGATLAALSAGGSLIVFSLLLLIIVSRTLSDKPAKKQSSGSSGTANTQPVTTTPDNTLEQQLRPVLGDQATEWAKRHSGMTVAAALSAGVLIAASPRVRAALLGAVGPIFTRKAMQAVDQFTQR